MKSVLILPMVSGLFLLASTLAEAHALLDHADPKVGSTVANPAQVQVWFTKALKDTFSQLQVFDAAGIEVDKKDVKVSGGTIAVTLPKLPPGAYKVVWKAVSADTHQTSGSFVFNVK